MSWSVTAIGKAAAVKTKLQADFDKISCREPEQTIKNTIADAVERALAAFGVGTAVRVEASGSQYQPDSSKPDVVNTLAVKIEPLYGFVE